MVNGEVYFYFSICYYSHGNKPQILSFQICGLFRVTYDRQKGLNMIYAVFFVSIGHVFREVRFKCMALIRILRNYIVFFPVHSYQE